MKYPLDHFAETAQSIRLDHLRGFGVSSATIATLQELFDSSRRVQVDQILTKKAGR